MLKSLFILGRQPALGRAELESLLGADQLESFGLQAVIATTPTKPAFFDRLGGSLKQATILTILGSASWPTIEKFAKTELVAQLPLPETGKLQLGISVYGVSIAPKQVEVLGLTLKKQLRAADHSVRLVTPQGQTNLSTAQILGNKLTGPQGREIVFYAEAGRTIVAITSAEQDINAYSWRDRERPLRDAKVGMLPPKLAQIIINLATGPRATGIVLDPFCGTGVLLQEALLLGYDAYGTDLEPRMIEYSQTNLNWLAERYNYPGTLSLATADATDFQWQQPIDIVAGETYLGRAFSHQPPDDQLMDAISTSNLIIKKFLRNIYDQLAPGTRLCLAVPAWQVQPNRFKHLPLLDLLEEMGYNRMSFEHAGVDELIYYRADQVVARELLVITRK